MKPIYYIALLGASFVFTACGQTNTAMTPASSAIPSPASLQKPVFATSFYPLAFFAEQIVGDKATVINLAGNTEIHDFSPSVQDMTRLLSSTVFFYHGAELEHWAEDMAKELNEKNVPTVELSSFLTLQKREAHEHEHEEHEHHHGEFDPHTWLDPVLAQSLASAMAKKMMETDPQNAAEYAKNLAVLQQKLSSLDASFVAKLKNCTHKEVIVSHDAFGYLAQRYGFTTHAIAGISTNDEPSAQLLATLQAEAKEGIKAVLAEQNSVQRFAKTIADEAGIQILEITALETPAENYFDGMQKNLNALSVALQCQ